MNGGSMFTMNILIVLSEKNIIHLNIVPPTKTDTGSTKAIPKYARIALQENFALIPRIA
jgi:hypothetical protein